MLASRTGRIALGSLVAPWYLMASVGLGFAATLGATVLAFQTGLGDPGLIFMLPIYICLFVVALGTDYNSLMIARLREEARSGLTALMCLFGRSGCVLRESPLRWLRRCRRHGVSTTGPARCSRSG